MAQIFVSHSARDQELVNFFSKVGAGTKVKLVFAEFERLVAQKVDGASIRRSIEDSSAVFVVLSVNATDLQQTRDWIVWESGVASNARKDLWIFEPVAQAVQVSVVIPQLSHYVNFEPSDNCLGYIRRVVESYDNSDALGAAVVGAGVAGAYGGLPGAAVGALGGFILSDKSKMRPVGNQIICPRCASVYSVHVSSISRTFRCPSCNGMLQLQEPQQVRR